jgi:serine/threonine protein kinase
MQLTNMHSNAIENLFSHGARLGRGAFGEARSVTHGEKKYVFKKFLRAKLDENEEQKHMRKVIEEHVHIEIWKRLTKGCRKYICEPILTNHPCISAQLSADDGRPDARMTTLYTMISLPLLPLSKKLEKVYTNTATMIKMQLADALMCLHSIGAVHTDLKGDNIMIVYELDASKKIIFLQIKVIDFGQSEVSREKMSLVRRGRNGTLDVSGVYTSLSDAYHDFTNSEKSKGFFSNAAYMRTPSIKVREQYLKTSLIDPLGGTMHAYENAWTRRHNAQIALVRRKLIQAIREYRSKKSPSGGPKKNVVVARHRVKSIGPPSVVPITSIFFSKPTSPTKKNHINVN